MSTSRTHVVKADHQQGMTLGELRQLVAGLDGANSACLVKAKVKMSGALRELSVDEGRRVDVQPPDTHV